ncbi:ABC transporter ATP-binding protein [Paenibacillus zeisoli]|uniref:ABC transporter ATP-binding protein n=1 Tax=Paenibacillus zeisoli TaxID=2496267 RepID=A0A433XHV0_9BACL|nr:ABC transporter ATP-binding protein [Paenibacillus zeisoli]RUT33650.1 ABC transporter ATP-binding protein [Paenibacillus zeisoli]
MKLLEVRSLTKSFGKHVAVNDLSFSIEKGHCVALLGANGAGKTTTLEMLSGLQQPTNGSVSFGDVHKGDYREYIGYLPQHPVFFPWMNGMEYLVFMGELSGLSKTKASTRANELLERLGIADAGKRKVGGYSGGMKQRLGIAQALIHEPKLLMLDEPVSALDPVGRREILELMKLLKETTTILFSTHILHDAEEVCDDVIMIHKGKLAITGSVSELRRKHQEDVIIISAEANLGAWARSIEDWNTVSKVKSTHNTVEIYVKNAAEARRQLLAEIAERQLPITSFTVAQTSLEDLFMEVVGK